MYLSLISFAVTNHSSYSILLFQRVLSSKSATRAQMLSYGGAAIALIMTGPSVLFGAVGKVGAMCIVSTGSYIY